MADYIIQDVILSYPNLWEPKQYKGTGKPRYSANFIFPANYDFTVIMQQIEQAKAEAGLPANCHIPLSQVEDGPYKGQWQIAAYAYNYAPQVVDQALNPVMDKSQVFAGCKVNANIDIYAYTNVGSGVSAGLKHVMIVDNSDAMPRLDNRRDAADVFSAVQGAPAPTAPVMGQPAAGMGQSAPISTPQGVPQVGAPATPAPVPQGQVPMGAPISAPQSPVQNAPMGSPVNPNDPNSYLG